jgi:hypothetical protein
MRRNKIEKTTRGKKNKVNNKLHEAESFLKR